MAETCFVATVPRSVNVAPASVERKNVAVSASTTTKSRRRRSRRLLQGCLTIMMAASASAQTWQRAFDGVANMQPFSGTIRADGSATISIGVEIFPLAKEVLLVNAAADGSLLSSLQIDRLMLDPEVVPLADGGVLVVGLEYAEDSGGEMKPLLARIGASGKPSWIRRYYPDAIDSDEAWFGAAVETSSGRIFAVGTVWHYFFPFQPSSAVIVELDPATGNVLWWEALGDRFLWYEFQHVIEAPDGGILASTGAWVVKFGAGRSLEWQRNLAGDILSPRLDASGAVVSAAATGAGAIQLARFDANTGTPLRYQELSLTSTGEAPTVLSISLAGDGGYLIAGQLGSPGPSVDADALLIRTDPAGTVRWARSYDLRGGKNDRFFGVEELATGGLRAIGGSDDLPWVLGLDVDGMPAAGCVTSRTLASSVVDTPATFTVTTVPFPSGTVQGVTGGAPPSSLHNPALAGFDPCLCPLLPPAVSSLTMSRSGDASLRGRPSLVPTATTCGP